MGNKILDKLRKNLDSTTVREAEVLGVSKQLQDALGLSNKDLHDLGHGEVLKCGRYNVIIESRCFTDGWHEVLEIISGVDSVGFAKRESWNVDSDLKGTRTTNVPTPDVVDEVIRYIEKNNY